MTYLFYVSYEDLFLRPKCSIESEQEETEIKDFLKINDGVYSLSSLSLMYEMSSWFVTSLIKYVIS